MSVCNKIIKRVFIVVITGNPAFQVTCRVECSLSPLPVEMQIANIFLGRRFPGRRFLDRRFLGRRFLGRRFLGRRFLGNRFSSRPYLSRSSFSRS